MWRLLAHAMSLPLIHYGPFAQTAKRAICCQSPPKLPRSSCDHSHSDGPIRASGTCDRILIVHHPAKIRYFCHLLCCSIRPESAASHCRPCTLIETSYFFELAVSIAISLFESNSGSALATGVGFWSRCHWWHLPIARGFSLSPERTPKKQSRDLCTIHACKSGVALSDRTG